MKKKFLPLFIFMGIAMGTIKTTVSANVIDEVRISSNVKESQVHGKILDELGMPVIGATIQVKGTTSGTITNFDGEFDLDVNSNDVLVVSYVGYASQEVKVDGKDIVVTLKEDTEVLSEVVVLGYGANARKQDLSASVGVLNNTEELTTRPVSSTESMLQGQLAGVTVQANGGDPTAAPSVVIRGQGSQNGDNVFG